MTVCRLCLTKITQRCIKLFEECDSQKAKITLLMPEIDTSIIPIFSLCNDCEKSLDAAYIFKSACIETDSYIKQYVNSMGQLLLNLDEIRNQKLCDIEEVKCNDEIKNETVDLNGEIAHCVNIEEIKGNVSLSFVCDKCNMTFCDNNLYERHRVNCTYICDPLLNEETIEDVQKISKRFTCDLCQKSYGRRYDLKRHINKTHLKCSICGDVFQSIKALEEHNLKHNIEERPYMCDKCDIGYNTLSALVKHKEIHSEEKYSCTICVKSYTSRNGLRQHMANAHFGTYICEACGIKFGTKSRLAEHMRTHTGERPYKCEICGKGFAQQGTLGTHIRYKHKTERPFICDICGKGFPLKASLLLHEVVHEENREKNCICTVCNKGFTSNKRLCEHMSRHKRGKKHKCSVCTKDFLNRSSLQKHMRRHTGERPFECHTCQKRFNDKYNLQIHFRSHRPRMKVLK